MKNYLLSLITIQLFLNACASQPTQANQPSANTNTTATPQSPSASPTPAPTVRSAPLSNPGTELVSKELNAFLKLPFSDTTAVEVHYISNRQTQGDKFFCSDQNFLVSPGEKTNYGSCRINVPKRHRVGAFEMAPNPRADSHRYFKILSHRGLETEEAFKQNLLAKEPAEILLFVHGFNVKFEEANVRAAQIAYDVKFQGPVLLYTWPAGAGTGMLDSALVTRTYNQNLLNAKASIENFTQVLRMLSSLNIKVHILVHSMGHQIVIPALAQLSTENIQPFIGQLILNAPDFSVDDFIEKSPNVKNLTDRITLYCSYNDNAMAASETYNGGRRMGGCEAVDAVDVINVSEIDAPAMGVSGLGHGYYASRAILGDVYQVLLQIDAEKRLFMRKSEPNSTEDFILRP